MTQDRFPYDELRALGFDPAPLPSPQTPRADGFVGDKLARMYRDGVADDEITRRLLEPETKPPAPSIKTHALSETMPPGQPVPLAAKHAGDAALRVALDCLAEIVFGTGYRVPIYHKARAALETLGITKAPDLK